MSQVKTGVHMTIVAEILKGVDARQPLAKVRLAALPRVGEAIYFEDAYHNVSSVDHFAVNAEQQYIDGVALLEGDPYVLIVVK